MDAATLVTLVLGIISTGGLIVVALINRNTSLAQKQLAQTSKESAEELRKLNERNQRIGEARLKREEAEWNAEKASRKLLRATATAVRDGKTNGEMSKALEAFDEAEDKEDAAQRESFLKLKAIYDEKQSSVH